MLCHTTKHRVIAYHEVTLAALLPARMAVVEITLTDGTRLVERVEAVRGTVRNLMPRSEVADKARDLIAPVLGAATAQTLVETLMAIENVKDVRTLRPLLQRA